MSKKISHLRSSIIEPAWKRRLIVFSVLILTVVVFGVHPVWAIETGLDKTGAASTLTSLSLPTLVGNIIKAFLGILGVVFLGLMIFAGTQWMLAFGEKGKVDKAREIIIQATIGLAIVLSSYALTDFVVTSLLQATTGQGQ